MPTYHCPRTVTDVRTVISAPPRPQPSCSHSPGSLVLKRSFASSACSVPLGLSPATVLLAWAACPNRGSRSGGVRRGWAGGRRSRWGLEGNAGAGGVRVRLEWAASARADEAGGSVSTYENAISFAYSIPYSDIVVYF